MRSAAACLSLLVAACAALLAGAACGRPATSGAAAPEVRVYAAASLSDVVVTLARRFEAKGAGRVVTSFGASSTLAQQIHEGAAAGVFVSASPEWTDRLEGWRLLEPGSRVDLAGNSLVVVVPRGTKDRPAALSDLTAARFPRLALADPVAVPAGRYAKAALESAGLFEGLRGRIVAAPDVRAALSWVARGEASAGIVYATDVGASPAAPGRGVEVACRVPRELHPPIVYPMVLVKGAGDAARAFHAFLQTPEARQVLDAAGFTRP